MIGMLLRCDKAQQPFVLSSVRYQKKKWWECCANTIKPTTSTLLQHVWDNMHFQCECDVVHIFWAHLHRLRQLFADHANFDTQMNLLQALSKLKNHVGKLLDTIGVSSGWRWLDWGIVSTGSWRLETWEKRRRSNDNTQGKSIKMVLACHIIDIILMIFISFTRSVLLW